MRPEPTSTRASVSLDGGSPQTATVRPVCRSDQRRTRHAEHLPCLPEQLDRVVAGVQQAVRQDGQRVGLGPGPDGLGGPPGGPVDDGGHRHADHHEDHDGERVLRIGDGQRAGRRHEQEVQGHAGQQRGEHRRPQTTDQRRDHHHGQHQQRLGRQPVQIGGQAETQGQHGRTDHGHQVTGGQSGPAQRPSPGAGSAGAAGVVVGDDVHVDVAGAGDHLLPHAGPQDGGQPTPPTGADQHLAGVDAAGHVQQPVGGVVGHDGLEPTPHLLGRHPQPFQRVGRDPGQPVTTADIHGQPLPARRPGSDPGGPPHQGQRPGPPDTPTTTRSRAASCRRSGAVRGSSPARHRPDRPTTAGRARATPRGCPRGSSWPAPRRSCPAA